MKDRYDIVVNSHHDYQTSGGPIAPVVMPAAIQCCKDLVAGTPHQIQIDNPLKLEGADQRSRSRLWMESAGLCLIRKEFTV